MMLLRWTGIARCVTVACAFVAVCLAEKEPIAPLDYQTPPVPGSAYFVDPFATTSGLGNRWILSKGKKEGDAGESTTYDGKWEISLPEDVLLKNDYGLVMKSAARHHAISAKLNRIFHFKTSSLVIQYDVKFQESMECGGGYIKLITHDKGVDLTYFNNKTPFTIMFGPDKCGASSKVHLIIHYKNPKTGEINEHAADPTDKNLAYLFQDKKTHLFTLVMNPDDSYYVYIDQSEVMRGNLKKNLKPNVVPDEEIDDPSDKKPADWDDREKIPDPNVKKPDDWDESQPQFVDDMDAIMPSDWYEDEPEFIVDAAAVQPSDWDEDMDGKWEAPLIANPKCKQGSGCGPWKRPQKANPLYKGKWSAPLIANPRYRGVWKPKKIKNPDYFTVDSVFQTLQSISAVGLELWTITPEVIFDNFLVTDSESDAKAFSMHTWYIKTTAEDLRQENVSFLRKLIKETESKPWLWVVYLLVILLPTVLFALWCFGPSKKVDHVAMAKKTDELREDDEAMEECHGEEAINEDGGDDLIDFSCEGDAGPHETDEHTGVSDLSDAESSPRNRRSARRAD